MTEQQPERVHRGMEGAVETRRRRREPAVAERRRRAVELYLAGMTFHQIAEQLGYAERGAARRAVMAALQESQQESAETIELARQKELDRLERLFQTHYAQARRGGEKATELCLKIIDRRARLQGLDAPIKVDHTVTAHIDAEIEALMDRAGLVIDAELVEPIDPPLTALAAGEELLPADLEDTDG